MFYNYNIKRAILSVLLLIFCINIFSQKLDSTKISKYEREICFDETKEDYQKSIVYFQEVISSDSTDLEAYYNLGMSYYKLIDFEKSIEVFDQLIEKDPCFNYALHNRGLCKFFLKDREGACKDFKLALQCDYQTNMDEIKNTYERFCK
ncbi:MAG: tetratricopeptide repeat protein [Bacteroidales bacterium]|nr:tetratricopeptide repeat protein [Bacteroidales bacterium]